MLSLYVSPLKFDNNKKDIKIGDERIEWKKQVATVSKKKDLEPIEYLNQKYGSKIGNKIGSITFGHFDYNDNSTIYLLYSPNPDKKPIVLTYDIYIPHDIEIVEESHDIELSDSGIIIHGEVYGFCLDNESYYFKNINVNEYIEFVQKDNNIPEDDIEDNNDNNESDLEYISDSENENEKSEDESDEEKSENESDKDEEKSVDENNMDEEDEYDDYEIDMDEKEDTKKKIKGNINGKINAEGEEDDIIEEGMGDEDDEEEEDVEEEQAVASVAGDDEEGVGVLEVDEFEEFDDIAEDKVIRRKKTKFNKSMKLGNNVDFSIILNLLEEESKEIITPEANLFNIRKINIQIFKKLPLSIKICQMIEKGIYNYTIEKCFNRQIIPLWDNQEFVDIYVGKSKNLFINLNEKSYVSNTNLFKKVKNGELQPYDLAFMDTYKLFPERWNEIMEEKFKKEKMINDSIQECASDLFVCPRCHKRKTIYCEVQTRSSDEPMTKFITCLECGKRWKKY
jgi:DNA-directed RNA polymerase subunit M/transcription elongation factor TFIIS